MVPATGVSASVQWPANIGLDQPVKARVHVCICETTVAGPVQLCVCVSMCQLQGRQGDTQLLEAPTLYVGIYGSSYWQTQTDATEPRQQGLLALSAPTCNVSPHTHYGMHKQSTYWLDNRNAVVDKEMTGVYKYENMNYKLSSFNLKKLMALK